MAWLLGDPSDFLRLQRESWTFNEIDKNLFTVKAFQIVKEGNFPALGVSTIVKMENGELVLINPIKLNDDMINKINSLGKVSHIISTTTHHSAFIMKTKQIFPDAKIVGVNGHKTEKSSKDIPFDLILQENKQNLPSEFVYLPIRGHLFDEVAIYHPKTKSLLGITDMFLIRPQGMPLTGLLYTFALGSYKPPNNDT